MKKKKNFKNVKKKKKTCEKKVSRIRNLELVTCFVSHILLHTRFVWTLLLRYNQMIQSNDTIKMIQSNVLNSLSLIALEDTVNFSQCV